MFTKIRHVAIHTDNHFRMANFYKTLFGMKKITAGMTDENGNYDKERGHLSDGVIGLALLQRQPGFPAGLDHFGLEVEDVQTVRDRLKQFYPDIFVIQSQSHVPFAGLEPTIRITTSSTFPKRVWPTCAKAISKKAGSSRAGSITSLFAARVRHTSLSITRRFSSSSPSKACRGITAITSPTAKSPSLSALGTWSNTAASKFPAPVNAAPSGLSGLNSTRVATTAEKVHWRPYRHHHRRYYRRGPGVSLYIGPGRRHHHHRHYRRW